MIITYILLKYTNIINTKTINVYSSIDKLTREYYIHNMKIAYIISTISLSFILLIFYIIHKKVAYKSIDYKKEGG